MSKQFLNCIKRNSLEGYYFERSNAINAHEA